MRDALPAIVRDVAVTNNPYGAGAWEVTEMTGHQLTYAQNWIDQGVAFASPPDANGDVRYYQVMYRRCLTLAEALEWTGQHRQVTLTVIRLDLLSN